jgi:hypothetical protein
VKEFFGGYNINQAADNAADEGLMVHPVFFHR